MMTCKDQHTQTDVQRSENWLVSVTSLSGLLLHTTIGILTEAKTKNLDYELQN